jgi:hypothetical protein
MEKTKKDTLGITLRPERDLLAHYEEIVSRANRLRVSAGERGNVTVQQVILHRMRSLPSWQAHCKRNSKNT